jgi:L-aspartate oxidase
MEFIQFHQPHYMKRLGAIFLITEAVRGDGGILRNHKGEAFMSNTTSVKTLPLVILLQGH